MERKIIQPGDVCRVVSPATLRTGRELKSQWICECPEGTLLKIIEYDSSEMGRQRAHVQTQVAYIFGWISIRTASLDYLVKTVEEEIIFEIPEAALLCGFDVDLSFKDPTNIRTATTYAIDRIKSQPAFLLLSQQTFAERIQGTVGLDWLKQGVSKECVRSWLHDVRWCQMCCHDMPKYDLKILSYTSARLIHTNTVHTNTMFWIYMLLVCYSGINV